GFGGGAINSETTPGDEPSVTVVDSSFDANAAIRGGALNNTDGWVQVQRSTFSNNSASEVGGAIYVDDADDMLELVNSTLSGNTADESGGGLFNSGIATIVNSTILGNVAPNGGGIRLTADSELNVTNTVVAGSTDGDNCADRK